MISKSSSLSRVLTLASVFAIAACGSGSGGSTGGGTAASTSSGGTPGSGSGTSGSSAGNSGASSSGTGDSATGSSGTNGSSAGGSSSGTSGSSTGDVAGTSGGAAGGTSGGDAGMTCPQPPGSCTPCPGDTGNATGVGAYCTNADADCTFPLACAASFSAGAGQNYCVQVGCPTFADGGYNCGANACCYGEVGNILNACVPSLCVVLPDGSCPPPP
jgi:hypothetical protein